MPRLLSPLLVLVGIGCGSTPVEPVAAPVSEAEAEPPPSAPTLREPYRCQLSEVYDDESGSTNYEFDAQGRVTSVASQFGASAATDTIITEYDEFGRASRLRYDAWQENGTAPAPGAPGEIEYEAGDGPRELVQIQRPDENSTMRTTFTYDEVGRVQRVEIHRRRVTPEDERAPDDDPVAEIIRRRRCAYDAQGRPTSVELSIGVRSAWTWGGDGAWPTAESRQIEDNPPSVGTVRTTEDGVEVRYDNDDGAIVRTYRGQCEDVFFRDCSPAFAPPPPGGSRVPLPRFE